MSNRDSQDAESFDIGEAKVQKYGLLLKRPFGHKSAKWQKRLEASGRKPRLTKLMVAAFYPPSGSLL